MVYLRSLTLLAATILMSAPSLAKVYQWTDENGQLHFSDKPPKGTEVTEVKNLPTKKHSPSAQSQKELDNYREQIKNDAQNMQDAKSKEESAKLTQKLDAEECAKAKKRLEKLTTYHRIRMENEKGELHYLTPEQKDNEIKSTQETIKDFCH